MEERIAALETSELEGGCEGIGVEGYGQLLALYLATGQLCEAKFLWKRVPVNMKNASEELHAIWGVGQTLWLKDTKRFHSTVSSFQWSPTIGPIMARAVARMRETTLSLIGSAYTCIKVQDAEELLGVTVGEPDLANVIGPLEWRVEGGLIYPSEVVPRGLSTSSHLVSVDDQIGKLTNYVSVLEN